MTEIEPFRCGHCGAPVPITGEMSQVRCPYCSRELQRPAAEAGEPATQQFLGQQARARVERAIARDGDYGPEPSSWMLLGATLLQRRPHVSNRRLTRLRTRWEVAEADIIERRIPQSDSLRADRANNQFVQQTRSLAFGMLDRNDVSGAVVVLERALSALPPNPASRLFLDCDLAFCQVLLGDLKSASRILESHDVPHANDDLGTAHRVALAWVALAQGRPKEVLEWLKVGDSESPLKISYMQIASAMVPILIASAFERLERPHSAVSALRDGLRAEYGYHWLLWLRRVAPQYRLCEKSHAEIVWTARWRSIQGPLWFFGPLMVLLYVFAYCVAEDLGYPGVWSAMAGGWRQAPPTSDLFLDGLRPLGAPAEGVPAASGSARPELHVPPRRPER